MNGIIYEKKEGIGVVTFNRPENLNTFSEQYFEKFQNILEEVSGDQSVRCLIITGRGRAFSAGQDLKELNQLLKGDVANEKMEQNLGRFQEITRLIVNMDKCVISAINGIAVGFGVEVGIACDIRIASQHASFAFPEVRIGLFETNGVMFFLPRIVGYGRAMEWLLTGNRVSAEEALVAGLVTHVVPQESLLDRAMEMAERVKKNAPHSVRMIKNAALKSMSADIETILELEVKNMMSCLESQDLKEGVRAFLEKRNPVF